MNLCIKLSCSIEIDQIRVTIIDETNQFIHESIDMRRFCVFDKNLLTCASYCIGAVACIYYSQDLWKGVNTILVLIVARSTESAEISSVSSIGGFGITKRPN